MKYLILCLIFFSGCITDDKEKTDDQKIIGTWVYTHIVEERLSSRVDENPTRTSYTNYLTFYKNNNMRAVATADKEPVDVIHGTWVMSGKKLIVTYDEKDTYYLQYKFIDGLLYIGTENEEDGTLEWAYFAKTDFDVDALAELAQ